MLSLRQVTLPSVQPIGHVRIFAQTSEPGQAELQVTLVINCFVYLSVHASCLAFSGEPLTSLCVCVYNRMPMVVDQVVTIEALTPLMGYITITVSDAYGATATTALIDILAPLTVAEESGRTVGRSVSASGYCDTECTAFSFVHAHCGHGHR